MARKASPRKNVVTPSRVGDTEPPIPFALPRVSKAKIARALELLAELREHYPTAHCELNFTSPHELLVATILSAQATDVGVNKATPALFARFPTPADYAASSPAEIEPYIQSIGLYRNKAKAIHAAMSAVVQEFGGEVPRTMDELLTLRGVARKTANVVLGNAFGINAGFVVDTHIERLAKRFDLAPQDASVQQVEHHLMALFPRDAWCDASHMLIWHGRRACKARMACCADHPICTRFGTRCELKREGTRRAKKATAQSPETPSGRAK
ncbi:MAG: endonuclease III [Phycisphaerales bacterium]|jgi:endonuclease-3|nr:endonuclease III [Phycisphaerales bacterium]